MATRIECDKCLDVEVLTEDEFMTQKSIKTAIDGKVYVLCPRCFTECQKIRDYWRNKEVTNLKDWISRA